MLELRAPDETRLRSLLEELQHAELTYPEAGTTRDGTLPSGYTHDRYATTLGEDDFDRAAGGLRAWQAHLGAGVGVYPPDAPLQPGTDVVVTARAGPLYALAPCRIVYACDEPDRFGFAYGTLPGHPECGEEAFLVERDAHGAVTFSIVAFSRPATLATRLGRPIARRVQQRTTRAYLDALRRYSTRPGTT